MAADRVITCTNKDGDFVTFTEKGFTPFILVSVEGIYDNVNNVNFMDNITTDGGIFQGSNAPIRNIVLTLMDKSGTKKASANDGIYINSAIIRGKTLEILDATTTWSSSVEQNFVEHRELLDKVFKRNELGRLSFKEGEEERVIDYYVEYCKSTGTHTTRLHTISLMCPDPFFYDPKDNHAFLSELVYDFKFIHEFVSSGESIGHFAIGYKNIINESGNENIGMTIMIHGAADLVNPVITRMDNGDYIQIGTDENPYTLLAGDSIIITTGAGNKHVYHVHNGVTEEINYLVADGSTFLQIMRGENNMYFNSDTGRNSATIEILYRLQYPRA